MPLSNLGKSLNSSQAGTAGKTKTNASINTISNSPSTAIPNKGPMAGTAGKGQTNARYTTLSGNSTPTNKNRGANKSANAGTVGKKRMSYRLHAILAVARAKRLLRLGKITQAQYAAHVAVAHPKGQTPITGTGYNQQQPITTGASPVKSMGAK